MDDTPCRVSADLRQYEAEQDAWDAAEPSQIAIKEKVAEMRWNLIADPDQFSDVIVDLEENDFDALQGGLVAVMRGEHDKAIACMQEFISLIQERITDEQAEYELRKEALDDLGF